MNRIRIRKTLMALACAAISLVSVAQGNNWQTDILGDGYESRRVEQGSDYSGRVV